MNWECEEALKIEPVLTLSLGMSLLPVEALPSRVAMFNLNVPLVPFATATLNLTVTINFLRKISTDATELSALKVLCVRRAKVQRELTTWCPSSQCLSLLQSLFLDLLPKSIPSNCTRITLHCSAD